MHWPNRPIFKGTVFKKAVLLVTLLLLAATLSAQHGATSGEWRSYHGDQGATQYAPLDQIDRDNFKDLVVAWQWSSPDNPISAENRQLRAFGYKSTPLEIGDVLYINTPLGLVAAIDAQTGKQLWVFDTDARAFGRPTNLGFNSRGVAYWTDGNEERIFEPTTDAHLWALDAKTGKVIEGFADEGRVDLTKGMRREVNRRNYTVMSSPLVVGDVVMIGSSIFDGPTRKEMPPGDVRGFDVRTGKQLWTFQSVPQPGEYGNNTWEEGSWEYTGNTNVWTNMSADPELGYVYLPFGTPTNDWYGGHRLGHDLFAESIVCLDAKTGKRIWHFQLVHHGLWDYDTPAAPTLFDLEIDGIQRKGVAVVTKQAFTYVFDRVTGEPIWPIEERPVPQSDVPGERTALTQPFPTKPPAFDRQGITPDDLIDFSPELHAEALEIVKEYRIGPIYTPPVVGTEELAGTIQLPGWGGGANWTGAALDPDTGYLYVPSASSPIVVTLTQPDQARSNFRYVRGRDPGGRRLEGPQGLPLIKPPYGRITAIDLKSGEIAWQVPHGDGIRQRIIDMGLPDPGPLGSASSTGPVLTKTLLFLGQGARGSRGVGAATKPKLRAFDKATGEVVHELDLPAFPSGTPMTYMSGGKQYIVMAVSGTESGLVALALPETTESRRTATSAAEDDGWTSIFDGKSLDGWKASENRDTFSVRDGMIVVNGPRSHLFYVGEVGGADLVNFEWQAEVKTEPGANSGMYFHTQYQEEGWPGKGYEAQINNTHGDPKKTGGLYGIVDVLEAPARDGEWFTQHIIVRGKRIVIKVNGEVTVDYTEPADLDRPERQLSSGTVALQGHDPESVIYYRNIRLKLLPD